MINLALIKDLEIKIRNVVDELKAKFLSFRTSRPTSSLVEDILVECYGSKSPLKNIASINILLPNIIVIEPWDKTILESIRKSIEISSLGVNPFLDGTQIKLFLPPLSEERRRELCHLVNEKKEEARIKVRKIREEYLTQLDALFSKKEISEDEKFRFKEEIQKIVDKINKEIEELSERKNKEIISI